MIGGRELADVTVSVCKVVTGALVMEDVFELDRDALEIRPTTEARGVYLSVGLRTAVVDT